MVDKGKVLLPPEYEESVFLEIEDTLVTVERVKWAALALFDDFPADLFASFLLGVTEKETINVEFVAFASCHPVIARSLQLEQVVTLFLIPHVNSEKKRSLNHTLGQSMQGMRSSTHSRRLLVPRRASERISRTSGKTFASRTTGKVTEEAASEEDSVVTQSLL